MHKQFFMLYEYINYSTYYTLQPNYIQMVET